MTDAQKREASRKFYNKWHGIGDEDREGRSYWLDILQQILGSVDATDRVDFEKKVVVDGHKKRIDVYIPETHTLIEQKSLGIELDKKALQSDGAYLTPYEQAKRYNDNLKQSEKAKWIIACNFSEIWIYDMDTVEPEKEVKKITIKELQDNPHILDFLLEAKITKVAPTELELSLAAGKLVGKIYDCLYKQYNDPESKEAQESLNILCVRLVFCLYAEDAGLFNSNDYFSKYLLQYEPKDMRNALLQLFKVLDTETDKRKDMYLSDELEQFPWVNGGLFRKEDIIIPKFTQEIKDTILEASHFNWKHISPTIFGAVFESTLNPETRRKGGMHYTAVEHIHKVIDPLFLDDLKEELDKILEIKIDKQRDRELKKYIEKLSKLTFFDPSCGSGNFLTETYLCLRRLENRCIDALNYGQAKFGDEHDNYINVSISQFYGLEINDFAVTVAMTALWIAESQMMQETESIVRIPLSLFPLRTKANIYEGNATRKDWNEIIDNSKLSYIIGNPPFVGTKLMEKEQKEDTEYVLKKIKKYGVLDYVSCWYKIACDYMNGTKVKCAFVSTNSIVQGEQVNPLWGYMFNNGIHIDFAHRTFEWDSEATDKAHVHCIVVGFSHFDEKKKRKLFEDDTCQLVDNINGYLIASPNIFIDNRKLPITGAEQMHNGCKFLDDGNYVFTQEEKDVFVKEDPKALQFIRPYYGAQNFISGEPLYCIWLKDADLAEVKKSKSVMERIEKVRKFRQSCNSADTQKYADRPMLPTRLAYYSYDKHTDNLLIPIVSSQNRRYIPIGYVDKDSIISYSCMLIPNASLYTFGIIESNVHQSWMRTVCGRMKSDFRYSNTIVYNNFPWPNPTEEQKKRIEETAQAILDTRKKYSQYTLAVLYDKDLMPDELKEVHLKNDRAVMRAYGLDIGKTSEADCVSFLMKKYIELTTK